MAMFCTGGIRCEKATSYLLAEGYEQVFHLKGGILKYLERVPEQDSLWNGDCYVFDNRVSVRHGLVEGDLIQCFACSYPVWPGDAHYVEGIQCANCVGTWSEEQLDRFRERQRQIELSRSRERSPSRSKHSAAKTHEAASAACVAHASNSLQFSSLSLRYASQTCAIISWCPIRASRDFLA